MIKLKRSEANALNNANVITTLFEAFTYKHYYDCLQYDDAIVVHYYKNVHADCMHSSELHAHFDANTNDAVVTHMRFDDVTSALAYVHSSIARHIAERALSVV